MIKLCNDTAGTNATDTIVIGTKNIGPNTTDRDTIGHKSTGTDRTGTKTTFTD